jgi:translation initiation factor 1A
MYQSSIRDKKKHKRFNHVRTDNYFINQEVEEFAYVKKLLGNCRVQLITNSGIDAIGIIRGTLRKFNKRILIETGDIVVVSKRDFQDSKVDIVHKYNQEQVNLLIQEEKLSNILCNFYNNHTPVIIEKTNEYNNDSYIDFGEMSDSSSSKSSE